MRDGRMYHGEQVKYAVVGLIVGASSALLIYGQAASILTLLFTILIGSCSLAAIGWVIDRRIAYDKPVSMHLMIATLLVVFWFVLALLLIPLDCEEGCDRVILENQFTGTCSAFCEACGVRPPWYFVPSERCVDIYILEECDRLTGEVYETRDLCEQALSEAIQ